MSLILDEIFKKMGVPDVIIPRENQSIGASTSVIT